MTAEQLLIPRIKVLALYPNSVFRIDRILLLNKLSQGKFYHQFTTDEPLHLTEEDTVLFPAIFRKLQWWEDRKQSEMPKYVKVNTHITSLFFGDTHKVRDWGKLPPVVPFPEEETETVLSRFFCRLVDTKSGDYAYGATHFLPATKQEFESKKIVTK